MWSRLGEGMVEETSLLGSGKRLCAEDTGKGSEDGRASSSSDASLSMEVARSIPLFFLLRFFFCLDLGLPLHEHQVLM